MNNFTYCTPTKYVFGRDAESRVAEEISRLGAKKILIVYGQGSAVRSGLIGKVKDCLKEAELSFIELSGVKPNPEDDLVYDGIKLCKDGEVDMLLAVGGGSVIDTAKAVAAGALYDGDFWDFYCGKATVTTALPVGVILTIPAAGSEGSGNSVITKHEGAVKISIRTDYALRPKFALLNPELTFSLPAKQTAAGIADMMAHIMERYFSPTKGVEVTDRLAEGLLMAIINEAPKVMANPADYEARANIMWSGTLAHNGICGCGRAEDWASHGLEHELSALYGVTHGAGLAVVFPAWMTYMAEKNPQKIAQLGRRVFGVDCAEDHTAAVETVARLRAFFAGIGLPLTLGELGITNPDFDELTLRVHAHKGTPFGTYLPLYPGDSKAIYQLMV